MYAPWSPSSLRSVKSRLAEKVMAVGVFAGIAVRDYTSAVELYKRLLGSELTFYPNDVEAVRSA